MAKRVFPPYSPAAGRRLFEGMDGGIAVRDLCEAEGMPDMETFKHWRSRKGSKEFAAGYAAAMERKRKRAETETGDRYERAQRHSG